MIHVLFLVNIPLALSEASVMCSCEFQELHVDCVFYSANVCEVFKIYHLNLGFVLFSSSCCRPCLYTWTMHTQNIHTNELRLIEMLGCRLVPFRFTKPCYFGKICPPHSFPLKKNWTGQQQKYVSNAHYVHASVPTPSCSYHCCSSLTSWDPRDGRCIRTAKLFNGKPTLVQTLRSGKHVVVCGHFMEIYVVDAIQFRVSARTIVCSQ